MKMLILSCHVLLFLCSSQMSLAEGAPTSPAMKRFTISPNNVDIYSCPPDRQIYFVQATIERQSIPVIMLDASGKEIPEGEFVVARSFRLDRAHVHTVSVIFACGY